MLLPTPSPDAGSQVQAIVAAQKAGTMSPEEFKQEIKKLSTRELKELVLLLNAHLYF